MRFQTACVEPTIVFTGTELMREELSHALVEALYELEILPKSEEGALVGIYAVMDDLHDALDRTEKLDRGPIH
jgi:hypothetical protein